MNVKGEIRAREELLVDGEVEGLLESQSLLTVGANGKVKANIKAREVIIYGSVRGDVEVTEKIAIREKGSLIGTSRARESASTTAPISKAASISYGPIRKSRPKRAKSPAVPGRSVRRSPVPGCAHTERRSSFRARVTRCADHEACAIPWGRCSLGGRTP
jgi:hypothetical protein